MFRTMITFILLLLVFETAKLCGQDMPHIEMTMECSVCHNPDNWKQIQFDHRTTSFPLQARHEDVKCQFCHTLQDFMRVSTACGTCHIDVHQGRLGPWCGSCHTPLGWQVIDHNLAHANTTFPLLGVHARLDCGACHFSEIEGEFSPLQSGCYSCHRSDYQSVESPDHEAAGFGFQCETCHNFFAWKPVQFIQHDGIFPIFSGSHSGVWDECRDCHISPGNFKIFSCLNCHEHERGRMDQKHQDVPGYVYESQACYNCHPTGIGDD